MEKGSICLCMMVKDEGPIIRRALQSVLPFVDYWAISDTGSTDATPSICADMLQDVPGRVFTDAWQDFATNRNLAYQHASASGSDYVLVMDADQTLVVDDASCLTGLTSDVYNIEIKHKGLSYPHPWLLRSGLPVEWQGATHEALVIQPGTTLESLGGLHLVEHADSHRRASGKKASEDRALLEAAYKENPRDARTVFYLGGLCVDEGKVPCAIRYYQERLLLGGYPEEVWYSQYRLGALFAASGQWEKGLDAFLAAYDLDPTRAEPLYRLGRALLMRHRPASAYLFFAMAANIPQPEGRLFTESIVYEYAAAWGKSMALRLLGQHDMAMDVEGEIMGAERTPARVITAIIDQRGTHSIGLLPG